MTTNWWDAALPLAIQVGFIGGLAVGLIGLIAKRTGYLVWASILVLPMSFYLTGNPGGRWGILIPFILLPLAYLTYKQGKK
jgi:hypothetical protein